LEYRLKYFLIDRILVLEIKNVCVREEFIVLEKNLLC